MDRILIASLLILLLAALPIWWPYGRRGRSSPSDSPTRLESLNLDIPVPSVASSAEIKVADLLL